MSLAIPPKIPNANLEFEAEAIAFLERHGAEGGEIPHG